MPKCIPDRVFALDEKYSSRANKPSSCQSKTSQGANIATNWLTDNHLCNKTPEEGCC